nr:STM4014 family protein [Pseudenhygromyxa sp. WMMC2535]
MRRRGQPAPIVVDHAELIAAPERLAELDAALGGEALWVRIDSAGESPVVERALLELGWEAVQALPEAQMPPHFERVSPEALAAAPPQYGQILAPRQHHLGFERYLDALATQLRARPHWRVLNPIPDLRLCFDKRATSRRYAAAGVPVPDPLPVHAGFDPQTPDQLREAMVALRWPSVFVKLSCGSSASCVALYRYLPRRGDMLLTTVENSRAGRFNSLRLQRLEDRGSVDALLTWLLAQGTQIERAIPKPRLGGRSFDLRVVVIAGEPAFCVVRTSRHPITNLHLGGARGDLEALRAQIDPAAWDAAMASCARVHAQHRCLHLGVDLLFEGDLVGHRVIEANAFGDLLPGLTRDGLDIYEWEIMAAPRWLAASTGGH